MDGPNVKWKLLGMIKQNRCNKNLQGLKILGIGSCGLHVINGAIGTTKSATDQNLKKFLKGYHSIFIKSPARRSDSLAANSLQSIYKGKDTSYLFHL